jgi:endonuclease-3
LNEVRVSTVGEVERAYEGQPESEWRAYRTISVLKFIFDKVYAFEFESLRKKTLDLATKQLGKIKELSPFVRDYTLHEVTGAHLVPIDTSMSRLLVWLGLVLPNQNHEQIGETIRGFVRKAEVESFVFTLRCLATDPTKNVAFDPAKYPVPEAGYDLEATADRLTNLLKKGPEKPAKPAPVKPVKKEAAASTPKVKVSSTKTVKKPVKPAPAKDKKHPAAKKVVKKGR